MSIEYKVINALLKTHLEYIRLFEILGDKRYLQRANNCIEIIRQHVQLRAELSE